MISYRLKRIAEAMERKNDIEQEKLDIRYEEELLGLEDLKSIDARPVTKSGN